MSEGARRGLLTTRQNPERIFRYYLKDLIQDRTLDEIPESV